LFLQFYFYLETALRVAGGSKVGQGAVKYVEMTEGLIGGIEERMRVG